MTVMGLDISTKTGVVVLDETGKVLEAKQLEFPKLIGWDRVDSIDKAIWHCLADHSIDLIVIESLPMVRPATAMILAAIHFPIRYGLSCIERTDELMVGPSQLKKFITGRGNSQKNEMMMHTLKHYGYESATDNISDAYGLARIGLVKLGYASTINKAQEEVMEKLNENN